MSYTLFMDFEQFEKLKAENEVLQSKLDDALSLAVKLLDVITYDGGHITADDLEAMGQELRHIKCRKGKG
jgi:hypothetical protein